MFSALNQAVISTFAQDGFIYKGNSLYGIFDDKPADATAGSVSFQDKTYTLSVLETVVAENKIEALETILFKGIKYQILSPIQTDSAGMSTLTLRKY